VTVCAQPAASGAAIVTSTINPALDVTTETDVVVAADETRCGQALYSRAAAESASRNCSALRCRPSFRPAVRPEIWSPTLSPTAGFRSARP
jgi:hypothetical protein